MNKTCSRLRSLIVFLGLYGIIGFEEARRRASESALCRGRAVTVVEDALKMEEPACRGARSEAKEIVLDQ